MRREYDEWRRRPSGAVIGLALIGVFVMSNRPASSDVPYEVPPPEIVDIVDAPLPPGASVSPDREWMVLLERAPLSSVADLAEPELRLAGIRFRPATTALSRLRPATGLRVRRVLDSTEMPIAGMPTADPGISYLTWSPNGRRFAFVSHTEGGLDLYVVDLESARARRVLDGKLNGVTGRPYSWLPDSETLVCRVVPASRRPAPERPKVPVGPVVEAHVGEGSPNRTYQDLLEDAHDEALFAHYMQSQLVRVGLDGSSRNLGAPGILWNVQPSPNGAYLLVETVHEPFSYQVPARYFPRAVEVWDLSGTIIKEIAELPLHQGIPTAFGSVPPGPRGYGWRHDALASLVWVEAQDGGDAGQEAEARDKVFLLEAPFEAEPNVLQTMELRLAGMTWGDDDLAIFYEWWWKSRTIRAWLTKPGIPSHDPRLLWEHSWEDRYNDPGEPLTWPNENGQRVLVTADAGTAIYLTGKGASPEGDRPFLDRLDLLTGETDRLWRSEPPYLEMPTAFLDRDQDLLLTRRESRAEPPNYVARRLSTGELQPLTAFEHPAPELRDIEKEIVRITRADGVDLTGQLFLPPGHTPDDDPLPMLVWAYPREFKSADAAGQMNTSPHKFDYIYWTSPLVWNTQGYAVLYSPTMPIVGEGDAEPNDDYVRQLVSSAEAWVDEMVQRGVADPARIVIGGHSYGAFTAANLLAHTDLFCAGIARSGAYNRTLTPFGFQAEERTYWEAEPVYRTMSPFTHADKINEPILLIHGDADDNTGTYPVQSERFYEALKGLGATARFVRLPYESHGYKARESILHVLWEMNQWMDRYARGAPNAAAPEEDADDVGMLRP